MQLDQCLFGYEDGHRLLASSMPLGDQTSLLTELSDLAPGTVFGGSDGYWTGLPAPLIGRYALMRTWPAPEMPRPGCVWTHALLIELSMLEEAADLAVFATLASRPHDTADWNSYRDRLTLDPSLIEGSDMAGNLDEGIVRNLLAALYTAPVRAVGVPAPGRADRAVFAVWSQQWPRLRRNLHFQTAAKREGQSSAATRLDIELQLDISERPVREAFGSDWMEAAVADLGTGASGALRCFLWHYGQDVKRQRGSFRPLVEVKLLHDGTREDAGPILLDLVARSFSDREDARLLKQDVVDGVLVPGAQLEVLRFVLARGGEAVFPPPTAAGVARLALLWPESALQLLRLAESTADAGADDRIGRSVFETVTAAMPADDFWTYAASYPRVRLRLLATRPELLLSEGVLKLDDVTLASLLEFVPVGSTLMTGFVALLLSREDANLVEAAMARFGRSVAFQVVESVNRDPAGTARAWVQGLVRDPAVLLDVAVMGRITRTSLLYEFAEALGWLSRAVVAAGTEPWIAALVDASNDLSEEKRDVLRAFLVALALASEGDGARRVLEKFFDAVHDQILRSRLPPRARDILSPLLPALGWGRGWDFGLRLRLAVASVYVRRGYSPESFGKLAQGRKSRTMLADAAAEVRGGKPFAKAAGG